MKDKKIYNWQLEGFAKGIDPQKAAREFARIERIYGSLTAENILEAAKPEDSLFHKLFTWDDTIAARNYRLSEARRIINNIQVTTIYHGRPIMVSAYEVISRKDEDRRYIRIDQMQPDDIDQVKQSVITQLRALKIKLAVFKRFDDVLFQIEKTTEMLVSS